MPKLENTQIQPEQLNQYLQNLFNLVPKETRGKIDDYFTNYLRNTTSDQEILDFYGDGRIVGNKGIPPSARELINSVIASQSKDTVRPTSTRPNYAVGRILGQEIDYRYTTKDIEGVSNPLTNKNWQLTFGVLPKDFGSKSLTPVAQQFLNDFRVPKNSGNDYSFATGPNIDDRINTDLYNFKNGRALDGSLRDNPDKINAEIEKIKNQTPHIGDYSGFPRTPQTWIEHGYVTSKPPGFNEAVMTHFQNRILKEQGPFGGVSTLTPVHDFSSDNPYWRADMYEKYGFAGPISKQPYNTGYGRDEIDVQRFTTGNERLLPLMPYTTYDEKLGGTRASAVAGDPAPDFTDFQKAIGPRNYLIGYNILEGRGSLGQTVHNIGRGIKGGLTFGATDLIPSPEVVRQLQENPKDLGKAARVYGSGIISGIPTAMGVGALVSAVPPLAPIVPPAVGALAMMGVADTINTAYRGVTGKDWSNRNQPAPFVGGPSQTPTIKPRTGTAILNGRRIEVPWGSVAGVKRVGRPWWDQLGSTIQSGFDSLSRGSSLSAATAPVVNSSQNRRRQEQRNNSSQPRTTVAPPRNIFSIADNELRYWLNRFLGK